MFAADARVCSLTRVRLRGRLEAYGVGGTITTGRWEGVLWGGAEGERDAGRAGFVVCGCDALFVWCAGWRRRVKLPEHACCGVRVELGSWDGGSWRGTSARCVLWVLVGALGCRRVFALRACRV